MRALACGILSGVLVSVSPGTSQKTGPALAKVCAFRAGGLVELQAAIDSTTGDTIVEGRKLSEALPSNLPPYVGEADWYRRYEPITVDNRRFLTQGYGPRRIWPHELRYYGDTRGVPIFVERGSGGSPDVVYLLISPACLFQPYPYFGAR